MNRFCFRFAPVNGYDIPGLERWLGGMAAKGLRFVLTMGPLTQFERTEPQNLRFHLQPVRGPVQEDPELTALYAEQGWEYLGIWKMCLHVFATGAEDAQAHTDDEVESYGVDKVIRHLYTRLIPLTAILLLWGYFALDDLDSWSWMFRFDFKFFPLYTFTTRYLALWKVPAFLALLLWEGSLVSGLFRLEHLHGRLKGWTRPLKPVKKPRGGWWMKAAALCLALIPLCVLFQTHSRDSVPLEELSADMGYVLLDDLESKPGFRIYREQPHNSYASHTWHLLVPEQYFSRVTGDYSTQEHTYRNGHEISLPSSDGSASLSVTSGSGVTITTWTTNYYLETRLMRCLTPGIADRIWSEQSTWAMFVDGSDLNFPGFDRLRLGQGQRKDGLKRWNLYGQRGEKLLFVEYVGDADLEDYLPRFARMLDEL